MKAGVVPYGRVYYCHHFTRDLVWRDEWRHHANGTVAVARALIVEPDPAAGAKLYADMFGPEAVRDIKGGKTVVIGNSRFDIVTEAELKAAVRRRRCPTPRAARPTWPASPSARCRSPRRRAALQEGKIAVIVQSTGRLVVPAKAGGERRALEFASPGVGASGGMVTIKYDNQGDAISRDVPRDGAGADRCRRQRQRAALQLRRL